MNSYMMQDGVCERFVAVAGEAACTGAVDFWSVFFFDGVGLGVVGVVEVFEGEGATRGRRMRMRGKMREGRCIVRGVNRMGRSLFC